MACNSELAEVHPIMLPLSSEQLPMHLSEVETIANDLTTPMWEPNTSPVASRLFSVISDSLSLPGIYSLRLGILKTLYKVMSNASKFEELKQSISEEEIQQSLDYFIAIADLLRKYEKKLVLALQETEEAIRYTNFGLTPHKQLQNGGHHPERIKITVVQYSSYHERELRKHLAAEEGTQRSDIVLFYEYCMGSISPAPLETQASIIEYMKIAKEYQTYICLGTGMESDPKKGVQYCTSVLPPCPRKQVLHVPVN